MNPLISISDTIETTQRVYSVNVKDAEYISRAVDALIGQIYYNSGLRDDSIKIVELVWSNGWLTITLEMNI